MRNFIRISLGFLASENLYRVTGLLCDIVCMILYLAVSAEHQLVTNRQTDKHTTMAYTEIP